MAYLLLSLLAYTLLADDKRRYEKSNSQSKKIDPDHNRSRKGSLNKQLCTFLGKNQ